MLDINGEIVYILANCLIYYILFGIYIIISI